MNTKESTYTELASKQSLKHSIAVKYVRALMTGIMKKNPGKKMKIRKLLKNKRAVFRAAIKIAHNDKAFINLYGNMNEKQLMDARNLKDSDIAIAMTAERRRIKEAENAIAARKESERRMLEMNNRHEIPQINTPSNAARGM